MPRLNIDGTVIEEDESDLMTSEHSESQADKSDDGVES